MFKFDGTIKKILIIFLRLVPIYPFTMYPYKNYRVVRIHKLNKMPFK